MKKCQMYFLLMSVTFVLVACATPPVVPPTQTPYVITASPGPTQTPVIITATPVPPTQTPYVITATPALTELTTQTLIRPIVTLSTTYTPTVAVLATSTPTAIYFDPTPQDPPSGSQFTGNSTILRWKFGQDLKEDEVFDVLAWPENGPEQTSIGSTRDRIYSVDFLTWKYGGRDVGKYFWTVRVKRVGGAYLSGASQPLWFVLLPKPCPPYPAGSNHC